MRERAGSTAAARSPGLDVVPWPSFACRLDRRSAASLRPRTRPISSTSASTPPRATSRTSRGSTAARSPPRRPRLRICATRRASFASRSSTTAPAPSTAGCLRSRLPSSSTRSRPRSPHARRNSPRPRRRRPVTTRARMAGPAPTSVLTPRVIHRALHVKRPRGKPPTAGGPGRCARPMRWCGWPRECSRAGRSRPRSRRTDTRSRSTSTPRCWSRAGPGAARSGTAGRAPAVIAATRASGGLNLVRGDEL